MAIDFLVHRGFLRKCGICGEEFFIQRRALVELWEDDRRFYSYKCKNCREYFELCISNMIGLKDTQLSRITVKKIA